MRGRNMSRSWKEFFGIEEIWDHQNLRGLSKV